MNIQNFDALLDHVDDFAELGSDLKKPVKHYSSGMRARLAFGLSLAIEFDCYLIDEVVAVSVPLLLLRWLNDVLAHATHPCGLRGNVPQVGHEHGH